MKQLVDGIIVESEPLTPAEIAELVSAQRKADIAKCRRPLTDAEVSRMLITALVNTLTVDDNTALRMLEFYPEWTPGTAYAVGFMVQYDSKLWRTLQAHTAQVGWEPENAPSLWEQIVRNYAGTEDDPVPYDGNMRLEAGKYYIQNDVIYLCIRDTGNPVYHALADLIEIYVEVVL
jgi:hypothetical protein